MRHIVQRIVRGVIFCTVTIVIASCAVNKPGINREGSKSAVYESEEGLPRIDAIRLRVARNALANGDYNTAIRFFESVHNSSPSHPAPLLGIAQAYLAAGNFAEAVRAYHRVLEVDSDQEKALDGIGRALVSAGQYRDAIEYFNRLLAEAPSAALYNRLGVAYDLMGDGENAQIHYRAALELDPEAISPRNNLALSLAISESYAEAIKHMERVVAHPQATRKHRQNLAFIYGMAGEHNAVAAANSESGLSPSEIAKKRELYKRLRALAKAGDRAAILEYLRSGKLAGGTAFADNMSEPADPYEDYASAGDTGTPATGAEVTPPKPLINKQVVPKDSASRPTQMAKRSQSGKAARKWAGRSGGSGGKPPKDGYYRVQLSAYRTARNAARGVKVLQRILQENTPAMEILVREIRRPHAIDYRIRTPRLPDRDTAGQLCTSVQSSGHPDCLVILHNPRVWASVDRIGPPSVADVGSGGSGAWRLQLASYRTEQGAEKGRTILKRLMGDRTVDLEILVRRPLSDDPSAFDYQIRSGPLESRAAGLGLCDTLKKAGHSGCLIVRHNDFLWRKRADAAQQETPSVTVSAVAPPKGPQVPVPDDGMADPPAAATKIESAAGSMSKAPDSPPSDPDSAEQKPASPAYRLQLASFRTERGAMRGQAKLRKLLGDRPVGLDVLVRSPKSGDAKAFDYQIRTGPIRSRAEGEGLCQALKAAGHNGCLIVQHDGLQWKSLAKSGEPRESPTEVSTVSPEPARPAAEIEAAPPTELQPAAPTRVVSTVPLGAVDAVATTYRVQLASFRTERAAIKGRAVLSKLLGDREVSLDIMVRQATGGRPGSFAYQIRTGPIQSRDEGESLCAAFTKAGHKGCLIVRHDEHLWRSLANAEKRKKASLEPAEVPADKVAFSTGPPLPTDLQEDPPPPVIELPSASVMEGGHTVTIGPGAMNTVPVVPASDPMAFI